MTLRPSARALVRLAIGLLLVGALAGGWEILASQSPYSPFRLGVLPAPIAQLRATAITLALLHFSAAWLLPWMAPDREPTYLVTALYVGSLLTIAALLYGAATGMMGLQIDDVRTDARILLATRATGLVILLLCLLDVARRVLRR
ncbi:MAG: hypothetical protein ACOC9O_03060 [Myxococcota bacterium]